MRNVTRGVVVATLFSVLTSCDAPSGIAGDGGRSDSGLDAAHVDHDAASTDDADTPPIDAAASDDAAIDDASTTPDAAMLDCPDLRTWDWVGETVDSSGVTGVFAGGDWRYDVQYAPHQIRADADHFREPGTASIRAFIDPSIPVPAGSSFEANFRSEIATMDWHEAVPMGTEVWIGFSYYLPPSYVQDTSDRATIFQLHAGRHSPPVEIAHWVPVDHSGMYGTQLHLIRRWRAYSAGLDEVATVPIELEPDHWYDFVVHVIWDVEGGADDGLTELWVNGMHVSMSGPNMFDAGTDPEPPGDTPLPYGGTPKFGWYKWPWHTLAGVAASDAAGVSELEMYIGAIRIMRHPAGEHVGDVGYDCVAPRGPRP